MPADVRELHGYTPWYFNLPDADKTDAWKQLMDPKGFYAPFGPTTAEQRHPKFAVSYSGHECQWNGPSWPYATAVTLTAMANLLNGPTQDAVTLQGLLRAAKDLCQVPALKARGREARTVDRREPQSLHGRLAFAHAIEIVEQGNLGRGQGRHRTRQGLQPLDLLRFDH